jgi:hypothetical protein
MRPEIWVSVTCTDRSDSLRALAEDLVAQAAQANVWLRMLINDNSLRLSERVALELLGEELRRAGIAVDLARAPAAGASIAVSRRRQREQVRARLATEARPALVWMLDDDVRLSHLHWTGDVIEESPLHCHVDFLLQLAARHPSLSVLIGEVCGDAPIPVIGTVVGRLSDLAANLEAMFRARPDVAWRATDVALARLTEIDSYYDLSHERARDAWRREVLWLPRARPLDTQQALAQMIAEVEHIPRGGAFSRPILASPERFDHLAVRPVRGGNAVFFDVDQCLKHDYPSVIIGGIETRRSDMIGTSHLRNKGANVRGSGFSVLHRRSRRAAWPGRDELTASMVADTLGAWLARVCDAPSGDSQGEPFLAERLGRLGAAARTLVELTARLRRLVSGAPPWAPPLDPVLAVAEWALHSYPGAIDGALPDATVALLLARSTREAVTSAARSLGRADS